MRYLAITVIATLSVSAASAQQSGFNGGIRTFPSPAFTPIRGLTPPPALLPATVTRQSALPLVPPPVSPIMNSRIGTIGLYGGYGGYGGGYGYYPYYSPYYDSYYTSYGGYGGYGGYGYGGYGDYGGFSGPFAQLNYESTLPDLTYTARSLEPLPPLANDHPTTARLALQVPQGAKVWLQDKPIELDGSRTFESRELKPGESFTFTVRVAWTDKGKPVEEKRTLTMSGGDFQSLQYLAPPPSTTK